MTTPSPDFRPATCPRCGAAFACGAAADRTTPCPCTTIALDDTRLAELRSRYDGCLCMDCLRLLASLPGTPA